MPSEEKITTDFEAYNKGYEAGKQHSKPSPETLATLNAIKEDLKEWKLEVKSILTNIPTMDKMENFIIKTAEVIDSQNDEKISKLCDLNDKKYAGKIVEKIVFTFIGVLFVSIVGAVVTFIFKHIAIVNAMK